MEQKLQYEKFTEGASIVLGALMGLLIAIPLASTNLQASGSIVIAVAVTFGGITGYRRRKSKVFLYFCLLGICVLSTLISFSMVEGG